MDRQVPEKVLVQVDGQDMRFLDFARMIRRTEGNFDWSGTAADGVCDRENCLWRRSCFEESAAGKRLI